MARLIAGDPITMTATGARLAAGGGEVALLGARAVAGAVDVDLAAAALLWPPGAAVVGAKLAQVTAGGPASLAGLAITIEADAAKVVDAAVDLVAADVDQALDTEVRTVKLDPDAGDRNVVTRRQTLELTSTAGFRGITGRMGGTGLLEELRNGRVRLTLKGRILAGLSAGSNGTEMEALAGPTGSATWVFRNRQDAQRFLLQLGVGALRHGPPPVAVVTRLLTGRVARLPQPQRTSIGGQLEVTGKGAGRSGAGRLDVARATDRSYRGGTRRETEVQVELEADKLAPALTRSIRGREGKSDLRGGLAGQAAVTLVEYARGKLSSIKLRARVAARGTGGWDAGIASGGTRRQKSVEINLSIGLRGKNELGPRAARLARAIEGGHVGEARRLATDLVNRARQDGSIVRYQGEQTRGSIGAMVAGTGAKAEATYLAEHEIGR
ncbi:MAG TPA: hypothetical protein VF244_04585 [Acidimicrobiales bacterium]